MLLARALPVRKPSIFWEGEIPAKQEHQLLFEGGSKPCPFKRVYSGRRWLGRQLLQIDRWHLS